jgi:site-specific DNA recombinase
MRTVIYARFSTDNQNPLSCDDQIALCRERADREGWPVLATFQDDAISGAAGIGPDQRPGLNALLAMVERGGVDQVLTESTSRVARHVADAHTVRERIEFAGARLFTLYDGVVTPIIGFVKGFTDAQARADASHQIKRGQRAAVAQGRVSGGVAYGYRRVIRIDDRGEPVRGLREIDADQAEIVRRIFHEIAAGQSAQAVCRRLNDEGVPGPRGGVWRVTTLRGGNTWNLCLLRNPIYVGRIVYGRSRQVRNPVTRKRQMKPSDAAPIVQDAPQLRILDDALFDAVQARLAEAVGQRPERMRRPRHLLSGLGVCGVCGGPWNKVSNNRWACGRRHATGGSCCSNGREILTHIYERRVLADLKARMLAPEMVAAYVREYTLEYARQAATLGRERSKLERQLAEARRKLARLTAAIADGGHEFAEIRAAMATARGDADRLERELAGMDALPVLALHPGLADRYREQVEQLETALGGHEEAKLEAVPRLRALIARIIVRPASPPATRGCEVEVVRHFDQVLQIATGTHRR